MKTIIIDFKSVIFHNGKMNGGGFFSLELVDFLLSNNKVIKIVNNSTEYFTHLNEKNINLKENKSNKYIYIDPLFVKLNDEFEFDLYDASFFYIHGTRLLEMPYDINAYRYSKGLNKLKVLIKQTFFKKYYENKVRGEVSKVRDIKNSNILTPSEHSKYVIKSFLDIPINVIPPFVSKDIKLDETSYKLPSKNYILILNSERWVKNSYRFIKAFSELSAGSKVGDLDVIVLGKPAFSNKFNKNIIYLEYVKRNHLEILMKNALFLAYPSLNEGFGYPPLDCFKYGVPVLCSSVSATNIVYNGKVVFVNPFSEIEIKSRILYLLDLIDKDKIDRDDLIETFVKMKKDIESKWNDSLKLFA